MESDTTLILVDTERQWRGDGKVVAYWKIRETPDGSLSLPTLVDENIVELRQEYFAWTYALSNFEIDGRPLKTYLRILPGLSFWWMTLIAEKEPRKSPAIYSVFKLRALEKLYIRCECHGLIYVGADHALHQILRDWCNQLGHPYQWQRTEYPLSEAIPFIHRIKKSLPPIVLAVFYLLRKWWTRYRHVRPFKRFSSALFPVVTIVTYFPNVDGQKIKAGTFWSKYWGDLHQILDQMPITVNWVWHHVDKGEYTFKETLPFLDQCNQSDPSKHRFALIEQFATTAVLWRALMLYIQIYWKGRQASTSQKAFHFVDSVLNFFPLLRRDWETSFFGATAMDNALYVMLFDEMAKHLHAMPWGMFVWENQPWELALMSAWRRHHTSKCLVAYQHTTIRFLDLRMLAGESEIADTSIDARPLPDILAVNGTVSLQLLEEVRFPPTRLKPVEALRYMNLDKPLPERIEHKPRTLLVLGEYQREETMQQLKLLETAAREGGLALYKRLWIKPHPFCPIDAMINDLDFACGYSIVRESLSSLWSEVDVAFVANSTGAVIEALYMKIPVAVCVPKNSMNLSPAFHTLNVPMISSVHELISFLHFPVLPESPDGYLILDSSLPRWRDLLNDIGK